MLPSEAPMPPCAATVCERVGKTFVKTATLRPARASRSDACIPEPPAPTMTTSKRRVAMLEVWTAGASISEPPEDLDRPAGAADQPGDGEDVERESDADRLDVVHPDVAHADPDVIEQGDDGDEGEHLHPLRREDRRPAVVVELAAEQDAGDDGDREDRHQDRG